MKNFSSYILTIVGLMLVACSNPLDKKFDRETAESDFARIVKLEKISEEDAYIMSHFMVEHDLIGAQVLELNATYRDILDEAKKFCEETNCQRSANDGKNKEKATLPPTPTDSTSKNLKVTIQPIANQVQRSEWSHSMKYHVIIENTSAQTIKALKGNFVFYDAFGDRINAVEYKFLDPLAPQERVERDVTLRLQNTTPQLILEYGETVPFNVVWETGGILFQ